MNSVSWAYNEGRFYQNDREQWYPTLLEHSGQDDWNAVTFDDTLLEYICARPDECGTELRPCDENGSPRDCFIGKFFLFLILVQENVLLVIFFRF